MISCTVDDEIFLTISCWELSWNCSTICRCSILFFCGLSNLSNHYLTMWLLDVLFIPNHFMNLLPISLFSCKLILFFLLVGYLSLFQSVLKLFFWCHQTQNDQIYKLNIKYCSSLQSSLSWYIIVCLPSGHLCNWLSIESWVCNTLNFWATGWPSQLLETCEIRNQLLLNKNKW